MANLTLEALHDLAVGVLCASRTSPENAAAVAEALVAAEADGLAGHGASRLPSYADQAVSGKVDGFATPGLSETAAGAVRVDARNGFAYPAIVLGPDHPARMGAKTGVGTVGVGQSPTLEAAARPRWGVSAGRRARGGTHGGRDRRSRETRAAAATMDRGWAGRALPGGAPRAGHLIGAPHPAAGRPNWPADPTS